MAGSIYLPILSSFNASGVNAAKQSLGGLATAFDGVKRALGVASASFVAFKAVSETIDFGRSSILAARDLERNLNALDSVFGNLSPQMEQFAANGVKMGLSQVDAAKASTFLGSVLKQAGFGMDIVASQTQKLVGLASDLATTYGYDVSEALTGMTALFRGEYDPIEKFGVAMKQSEVNAILAANGQSKLTGAARRNAEQMARLALLYERTGDAQGAFEKGAGTLFVEQMKLQAIFSNLQAEVGKALVPALVKVAEAMQPLVKALAPAITELFTQFAAIISILSGQLSNAQSSLYKFVQLMGGLFKVLVAILPFILDNGVAIAAFIATFKGIMVVVPILQAMRVQFALLKMELAGGALAAAGFGTALNLALGPLGLAALGIALVVGALVNVSLTADKVGKSYDTANEKQAAFYKNAGQNLAGLADAQAKYASMNKFTGPNIGYLSTPAQKAVNLGKSETARELAQFQKRSGTLASGQLATSGPKDPFQQALEDLLKGIKTSTGAIANATGKATDDAKKKQEELAANLVKFKDELKGLGTALNPVAIVTREIGQFEQSTIDAFENINKKLDEGVKNKTIGTKNLTALRNYLVEQNKLIAEKAAERDAIVEKRNLAKTLIKDVTDAIKGLGALGGLLEKETRDVTVATTKIVDGFTITTKRTVEEVIGGQGVLSKLQGVVTKTKAFAKQLTDLKALGLNENLFKQIVEAGPDVGGELAKEILAGGGDSVKALNTTFKELEDVAGTIAEQTAQVMYGAGVDVSNGLVNGLLSQEAQIVAAAQKLADAFNAAYNEKLMQLEIPTPVAATPKTTTNVKNVTNNIVVKAPVSTKATGQQLQSAINKYSIPNAQLSVSTRRLL